MSNGGRLLGCHCTEAGRADMVRRVVHGGQSARAVAKDLGVCRLTVNLWVKRYLNGKSLEDHEGYKETK